MKYLLALGIAAATFGFAGPVEASCFFNKAICQAICSKDCCDALTISRPASQDRLGKIELAVLTSEYSQAEKTGVKGDFMRLLKAEIDRRK